MNRTYAIFTAAALCCGGTVLAAGGQNMVGSQSQNEGMVALPRTGAVKVDGNLDDWDFSGRIWIFSDESVRDTYSAEVAAMYDEEALYIGVKWKDATPMFNLVDPRFNPHDGWKSDAMQFRVATADQTTWLTTWYYTEAKQPVMDVSVWKEQTNDRGGQDTTLLTNPGGGADLGQGAQMAFRANDDKSGYVQEIRIPWDLLFAGEPEIEAGKSIRMGIEALWGDATGRNWPGHRYADNVQPGNTRREFFWSALHSWGDLTLIDRNHVEVRQYTRASDRLAGRLPIRVELPLDAERVSLAIDDAEGNRFRNIGGLSVAEYTVAQDDTRRVVEIPWDGLSDPRRSRTGTEQVIAGAGSYQVRGLYHTGLEASYEMSFYNNGTPPWETVDGTGGWGADHAPPVQVVRSGDRVSISWGFAEGGAGIIGVGRDGRKIWGEKRGGNVLAADDQYVFAMPESWHIKQEMLIRLDAATGAYAPFQRDGRELPFELPLETIFDGNPPGKVVALAADGQELAIAMSGGEIALVDRETAEIRQRIEVPGVAAMAFAADGSLYALAGGKVAEPAERELPAEGDQRVTMVGRHVARIDLSSGSIQRIETEGVHTPVAIAVDNDGNIVVADIGPDSQVKAFAPDGKLVYTCGKQGGRPLRGDFDPQAMVHMSSVAVDAQGQVWVTESWDYPRRVSVWGRDGKLVRDYLGGTGYSGTGSFLHESDPTLGYVGPLEFALDKQTRTWSLKRVLWVPDASRGERFAISTGNHVHPHRFDSDASGSMHKYLFAAPYRDWQGYVVYMERSDGQWAPVSAITVVGQISGQIDGKGVVTELPGGEFSDCNAFDGVFWNDTNRDAVAQRSECVIVKTTKPAKKVGDKGSTPLPAHSGWGARMDKQLRFFTSGIAAYEPVRFDSDGAPVFTPDSIREIGVNDRGDLVPLWDQDLLLCLSRTGYAGATLGLRGIDSKTGEIKWTYPDLYPGVHGSHRAPMPAPGMLIGPLKITGTAHINDTVGTVLHLRGNLGQDFLLTSDGLYIDAMFQDTRLPSESTPATEAELFDKPLSGFTMGGEPFNGWFGKQSDGVVRLTSAIARQACSIMTISGLDSVQRLPQQVLSVDQQLVSAFEADRDAAILAAADQVQRKYSISRVAAPMTIDAGESDWGNIPSMRIERTGSDDSAVARLAYDQQNLYAMVTVNDQTPWRNSGRDIARLFKTGDTIDLQLGASNPKERDPKAGDVRVVVGLVQKDPVVVLMKPVAPDAPATDRVVYSSPVQDRAFDQVIKLEAAQVKVARRGSSYTVELAVPWQQLGIEPRPGMELGGDVGFTGSDADGVNTVSRIYWSNPRTNLVNDEPSEAWLYPSLWGTFELAQ